MWEWDQKCTWAEQSDSRTLQYRLITTVAQGSWKHFLTYKCMTALLIIAHPFFSPNYCIKRQRMSEFLEATAKSSTVISQDLLQEAVFNTVITDV